MLGEEKEDLKVQEKEELTETENTSVKGMNIKKSGLENQMKIMQLTSLESRRGGHQQIGQCVLTFLVEQRAVVGSWSYSFSQGLAEQIWNVSASNVLLSLPIVRFLCFPVTQGVVEPLLKDHSFESGGVRDTLLRASVFRSTCQQISVTLISVSHVALFVWSSSSGSSGSRRKVGVEVYCLFVDRKASLSIGKHQSLCRVSKTTACSSRVLVLHRLLFLLSNRTNSLILLNLLVSALKCPLGHTGVNCCHVVLHVS
ncbi:hypothetical protein F2Q69_00055159 [Brassica cretica]|uniref:Uncharacterized protein n=1 Tax=Brassica cretica TaxID=69181 RepID=A0A8S9MRS7_BRACR|nr:hypothetical protein F2Q69_00055159 [Brassica cretica]